LKLAVGSWRSACAISTRAIDQFGIEQEEDLGGSTMWLCASSAFALDDLSCPSPSGSPEAGERGAKWPNEDSIMTNWASPAGRV